MWVHRQNTENLQSTWNVLKKWNHISNLVHCQQLSYREKENLNTSVHVYLKFGKFHTVDVPEQTSIIANAALNIVLIPAHVHVGNIIVHVHVHVHACN